MMNCKTSKICICGGGNLGQALAAVFASRGADVSVLTGHPKQWSDRPIACDLQGHQYRGTLRKVSSNPACVIPQAEIILLCLPGHCIAGALNSIAPYVDNETPIGSIVGSSGFFWMAKSLFPDRLLFAFQRVPFISRIDEYGKRVTIKGYKKSLHIAGTHFEDCNQVARKLSLLLGQTVDVLPHYLETALTNSNPLLHPCRLFGLLHEAPVYTSEPLFYEAWDNTSSQCLIACDSEFQAVLSHLPVTIQPLLDYYESTDAESLTQKMRSIEAFKGLTLKMVAGEEKEGALQPDLTSRYFIEDIPYGLIIIKSIALLTGTQTPHIDQVIRWAQQIMGKEYLVGNKLVGTEIAHSAAVQQLGITDLHKLIEL